MAKICAFVCFSVLVMDAAAGILGIEAQLALNKVKHRRMWVYECKGSYEAFKLGLLASVLLALAHLVANVLGGCMCIFLADQLDKSRTNRHLSFAFLIFSWITMAIGFPTLIIGMLENYKTTSSCAILHHPFLSTGGILCFIHSLFCLGFYISVITAPGKGKIDASDQKGLDL
ncbi:hypothetical protein AAG906_011809 [Vitis piasezkii]|uniref:G-protein coupled receptors family 1 profile domain-containing protein n=2 Tax=Vitis vinifera TaxID=29760 RepID=A0ABY9DZM8_VITVI|nr:protein DESIGUAL 2 [Vitis vinifera]WKA12354.1 hypothetical protein VitviT2T_029744 [Vitis vinifera]|eukprot:XP_002280141.1 PREDICTED: uncharacterized protein LOC100250297 [Vitis vinifera]